MAPGSVDLNPVLVIPGPGDVPEMTVGFHFLDDLEMDTVRGTDLFRDITYCHHCIKGLYLPLYEVTDIITF